MVQLQFQIQVQAPFQPVWQFYGKFQNVPKWDPNTTKAQIIRKNQNQIGSVYNITSIFNGQSSDISYQSMKYQVNHNRGYINLFGKNDKITADDQIICVKKGEKLTSIVYRADISLRGVLWLFTPFIISGLNKITVAARDGCLNKAKEMFGKAKIVK